MIITGKIYEIVQAPGGRDIFTVVLKKSRKGKAVYIPVVFFGRGRLKSKDGEGISVGMTIDVIFYVDAKFGLKNGFKTWWPNLIGERWRKYVPGKARKYTVSDRETGEILAVQKNLFF